MALQRYCPSCFKGTEYTVKLPNECKHCGKAFTFAFSSKKRGATPEKPKEINEDFEVEAEESEEFDESVVAAKKMRYIKALRGMKIGSTSSGATSIQLGDLLNNPDKYNDVGKR